jgi:hypothetical protein
VRRLSLLAPTLAAVAFLPGGTRQAPAHPCVQRGDIARPVPAANGQPAGIAVVTTVNDARVRPTRAWVGDTVQNRCLGFVETAADAPTRWIGFAPRPWFTRVMFPGAPDSARGNRDAAVLALAALPPWNPGTGATAASSVDPAPVAAPSATPTGVMPTDPVGQRFLSDFRRYADQHWQKEGVNYLFSNYYDGALAYYQAWRRLGDPEYRRRADAIVLDYRTRYLEKNNYGSSPHWAQLEGITEHYRLTHDEASRQAVLRTADKLAMAFLHSPYMTQKSGESRIAARVLHAQVLAWQLADPADKRKWAARADSALDLIAAWQQPDGSYPAAIVCGGQLNYMVGLLNDVLIKTYEGYRADPRIVPMVKRADDYLWNTQWNAADRAFNYASVDCSSRKVGGPKPSPDLNNLIVTSFGWLYKKTGDIRYHTAGEQIFAGGVNKAYLTGSKQFNENYTAAFRYLDYR